MNTNAAFGMLRDLASRAGHHLVWLSIAALFFVVEGAVYLTELKPFRRF